MSEGGWICPATMNMPVVGRIRRQVPIHLNLRFCIYEVRDHAEMLISYVKPGRRAYTPPT